MRLVFKQYNGNFVAAVDNADMPVPRVGEYIMHLDCYYQVLTVLSNINFAVVVYVGEKFTQQEFLAKNGLEII